MEDYKTIESALKKLVTNSEINTLSDQDSDQHTKKKLNFKQKIRTMKEQLQKQFKSAMHLFIIALVLMLGVTSFKAMAQNISSVSRNFKGGVVEHTQQEQGKSFDLSLVTKGINKSTLSSDWTPEFFKKFGLADQGAEIEFGQFATDSEGNIIYTITNGHQPFSMKAQTIKIDAAGNQLWMVEFSEYDFASGTNIAVDDDDNIYISGTVQEDGLHNSVYVIRYDANGNLIWTKIISEDYFATVQSDGLKVNENMVYLVSSASSGTDGIIESISSLSTSGDLNWTVQTPQGSDNQSQKYFESYINTDNELVIFGNSFKLDTYEYFPTITRIAPDGTIVSHQVSPNPMNHEKRVEYKNEMIYSWYFDGTALVIEKSDLDNNNVWTYNLATTSEYCYAYDIFIDVNDNVYGVIADGWDGGILYCKTDPAGTEVFNGAYTPIDANNLFIFDISADSFGDILLSGNGNSVETYEAVIVTAKIDNSGNFISETLISPDPNHPYTFSYDYYYANNMLYMGGLQYGAVNGSYEVSRTLFVPSVNFDGEIVSDNVTPFENLSRTFVWGSDLDSEGNMYHAANSAGKFKLIKQDTEGNVIGDYEYMTDFEDIGCATVKVTSDNSVIIGGYGSVDYYASTLLVKTDLNGEEIWSLDFSYGGETTKGQYIEEDSEGNYLVLSFDTDPETWAYRALLTKVSPDGEILWHYVNENPCPDGGEVYFLDIAPNNDIVFGGVEYNAQWQTDLYAEKVTSEGMQVWEFRENPGGNDIFGNADTDSDGNTYIAMESSSDNGGYGAVYRINDAGEKQWEFYKDNGFFYDLTINPSNEDYVYASGGFYEGEDFKAHLVAIHTGFGIEEWTATTGETGVFTNGLFVESDENYVFQQSLSYNPANEELSIGLVAFDSEGNVVNTFVEPCTIGGRNSTQAIGVVQNSDMIGFSSQVTIPGAGNVVGVSGLFPKPDFVGDNELMVANDLKVFPNPAMEQIFVEAEGMEKIQILDMSGRVVFENCELNDNEIIDISELSTGLYLVKVFSQNYITTSKLMVK